MWADVCSLYGRQLRILSNIVNIYMHKCIHILYGAHFEHTRKHTIWSFPICACVTIYSNHLFQGNRESLIHNEHTLLKVKPKHSTHTRSYTKNNHINYVCMYIHIMRPRYIAQQLRCAFGVVFGFSSNPLVSLDVSDRTNIK